jgi:hypothetical protein
VIRPPARGCGHPVPKGRKGIARGVSPGYETPPTGVAPEGRHRNRRTRRGIAPPGLRVFSDRFPRANALGYRLPPPVGAGRRRREEAKPIEEFASQRFLWEI